MDANEITCPKCGHLNNYISEGCVKCGIIFSKYFEMQKREQQLEGGGVPEASGEPGTIAANAAPFAANAAEQSPGSNTPEPEKIEETITMDINSLVSESEDLPPAEAAPAEEEPAPESAEISMSEIEMSVETETEASETAVQADTESPQAESEQEEPSSDPAASMAEAAPPAESSSAAAPAEDQIPELKTEEASLSDHSLDDKSPEPQQDDEPVSAEEVFNLGEPLAKEKDNVIPLKTEPKSEKPEPLMPPDPAADKMDALDQAQTESTPAAEPIVEPAAEPVAEVTDTPPAEDEAEILLEEVAEPVKADDAAAKAEDQNRIELLKKQKAALAKAAIAKKQKLAQAKKLEALKRQKIAQARAEALKRQKAAALKKQKLQAQAANQPTETQLPATAKSGALNIKLMGLLKKYEGQTIGINYDNSADIKEAELVEANDEFFSVTVKENKLQYSFPLQTLLSLIEGEDGVPSEASESKTKFSAVIKVYPLVLF
jgi:hypothetical protein